MYHYVVQLFEECTTWHTNLASHLDVVIWAAHDLWTFGLMSYSYGVGWRLKDRSLTHILNNKHAWIFYNVAVNLNRYTKTKQHIMAWKKGSLNTKYYLYFPPDKLIVCMSSFT